MNNPLQSLDQWEDFVADRYPQPGTKGKDDYRNYANPGRDSVREFYRLNHLHQTYEFVLEKKRKYLALEQREIYRTIFMSQVPRGDKGALGKHNPRCDPRARREAGCP